MLYWLKYCSFVILSIPCALLVEGAASWTLPFLSAGDTRGISTISLLLYTCGSRLADALSTVLSLKSHLLAEGAPGLGSRPSANRLISLSLRQSILISVIAALSFRSQEDYVRMGLLIVIYVSYAATINNLLLYLVPPNHWNQFESTLTFPFVFKSRQTMTVPTLMGLLAPVLFPLKSGLIWAVSLPAAVMATSGVMTVLNEILWPTVLLVIGGVASFAVAYLEFRRWNSTIAFATSMAMQLENERHSGPQIRSEQVFAGLQYLRKSLAEVRNEIAHVPWIGRRHAIWTSLAEADGKVDQQRVLARQHQEARP